MDEGLARVVGQRVRRLRQREGISLRRQAELVGVSPAALSALENGRGGMSLSTLQRVSSHLGLSITELLADPPERNGSPEPAEASVEIFEKCASAMTPVRRGADTLYQVLGSGKDHLIQPYVLTFLPDGGYASDQIGHPGEEFAYVVAGEVDLMLGEASYRLRQGDAIRFPAEVDHSFRNASSTGVAIVVGAATPPW